MKKIFILFILSFLVFSCGKDKATNNEPDPNGRADLQWTQTSVNRATHIPACRWYGTGITGIIRNDTPYEATGLTIYFVYSGTNTYPHSYISQTAIPANSGNVEIRAESCNSYYRSELERTFIVWD